MSLSPTFLFILKLIFFFMFLHPFAVFIAINLDTVNADFVVFFAIRIQAMTAVITQFIRCQITAKALSTFKAISIV